MNDWYKDRDFPEVKSSNADVIARIPNPGHLQRVIEEHNSVLEKLRECHRANRHLQAVIAEWKEFAEHIIAVEALTPGGSNEGWANRLIAAGEEQNK